MNGATLNPEYGLDEDELREAEALIRDATPGTYTLAKLYGPDWIAKDSPTTFGTRFRVSVDAGLLPGITYQGRTSANHARYEVHLR